MRHAMLALALTAALVSGCEEDTGPAIRGTIYMAPEMLAQVRGSDTLYIVARPAADAKAAPLAVKRVVGARFPYAYAIGPTDAMRPDVKLDAPMRVEAYIRRTGVAGMPVSGDMAGAYEKPVGLGDRAIDFNIDRRIP